MAQVTPGKALLTVFQANEVLRTMSPEMPIQMAQIFLAVAMQPGLTMKELSDRVGISQSSCSRNVAALGKQHRYGKPGFDVVLAEEDPAERRRKIVRLTPKGKRIADQLIEVMRAAMV